MQYFSDPKNLPRLIAIGSVCAFLTMFFVIVPTLEPLVYASYSSEVMDQTATFRAVMKWTMSLLAAGFMLFFAFITKRALDSKH